jgi:hypothetical protein
MQEYHENQEKYEQRRFQVLKQRGGEEFEKLKAEMAKK